MTRCAGAPSPKEGMRTFIVKLRIGTSGKGPVYDRTHVSLTPDTAVVESMAAFWEATGIEPEKLTLVSVEEIVSPTIRKHARH